MRNRLVPRAEWFSFLKGFSRRHEDDPVTVQVLAPGLGSQVEARALPLEGIMAGRRTSGPISISVGRTLDRHVEHEVPDPSQVWVQMSEDGAERALDIESQDGTRTIVQLEPEPQAKPRHLLPR
jgi:uncharacterized protein DUF5335